MLAPRALILRAPGTNCDHETAHAFERAGGLARRLHVRALGERPALADDFQILCIPGGFSYGDDIASGRIFALELRLRLGDALTRFRDRGGLVLGICNGFQVLVRLGLLPCTRGKLEEEVTLTHNLSNHYECRWVTLQTQKSRCVFLPAGLTVRWPAAHGEGRLVPKDDGLARVLLDEGFAALRYVDASGAPAQHYPANPNGSPNAIAGLTDRTGRVLGMMPHPDRSFLPTHMPNWRETMRQQGTMPEDGDGMVVFREMVKVARADG